MNEDELLTLVASVHSVPVLLQTPVRTFRCSTVVLQAAPRLESHGSTGFVRFRSTRSIPTFGAWLAWKCTMVSFQSGLSLVSEQSVD